MRAWGPGVKKVPAVVFDDKDVVYGTADVALAAGITRPLIVRAPAGGLDYSGSHALYNLREGVNLIVQIEYTGDCLQDFTAANLDAGLNQKTTPSGYVWHHLDGYNHETNIGTMQSVKQKAHQGIPHVGGVSQYKTAIGKTYTFPAINRVRKPVGGSC